MYKQKMIGIQETTYNRLKVLKKTGQSFDGIIQELIEINEKTKPQ